MIDEAIRIARRSPNRRFQTGAAVVRKGKVLTEGWAHIPAERLLLYSRHAEAHAIMRAHEDLGGSVCFIATISRNGNLTSGKPCSDCVRILMQAGISKVCYTVAGGGTVELDLNSPGHLKDYSKREGQ